MKLRFNPVGLLVYAQFLPTGVSQVYSSISLAAIFMRGKIGRPPRTIILTYCSLLLVVLNAFSLPLNSVAHWLNFISSLLCFVIGTVSVIKSPPNVIKLGIMFFIAEFVTRASLAFNGRGLLELKENSIFYMDSNFVAINLLLFYLFSISLSSASSRSSYDRYSLIFLLLMIGTLSKIGILTLIVVNFTKKQMGLFIPYLCLLIAALSIALLAVYHRDAFGTYYLRGLAMYNSFSEATMFGFGFNSTIELFGKYGHSGIAVLVNDIGVFGTLLFSFFILSVARIGRYQAYVVCFYLIMTLSLFSYSCHFAFWLLGYLTVNRSNVINST